MNLDLDLVFSFRRHVGFNNQCCLLAVSRRDVLHDGGNLQAESGLVGKRLLGNANKPFIVLEACNSKRLVAIADHLYFSQAHRLLGGQYADRDDLRIDR